MSSKWNFNKDKSNASRYSNYKPLDTNPDDYKTNSYRDAEYHDQDKPVEGVVLTYITGQTFRTKEFTVDDIFDAIHTKNEQWIKMENGGEINLGAVVHYEPFKFYPHRKFY